MSTSELLDRIAILQNDIVAVELDRDKRISATLPQDVRAYLNAIENECNERVADYRKQIDQLMAEIRSIVIQLGETQKSPSGMIAIYQPGRISWDTRALDGYSKAHPEVNDLKKVGEPFVVIRKM